MVETRAEGIHQEETRIEGEEEEREPTIVGGANLPPGVAIYPSRKMASESRLPSVITVIRTEGYSRAGDGGRAVYAKTDALEDRFPWTFTSKDGSVWVMKDNPKILPEMFGADPTGREDSAQAVTNAYEASIFLGAPRLHLSGRYRCSKRVRLAGDVGDRSSRYVSGDGASRGSCCLHFDPHVPSPCLEVPSMKGLNTVLECFEVVGNTDSGPVVQLGSPGEQSETFRVSWLRVKNMGRGGGVSLHGMYAGRFIISTSGSGGGTGLSVDGCVSSVFDQCVSDGFERAMSFEGKASSGVSGRSCVSRRSAVGLDMEPLSHRNNTMDSHLFDECPVAVRSTGGKRTVLRSPIFRKSRLGQENVGVSYEACQDLRPVTEPEFPESGVWFHTGYQAFEVCTFIRDEDTRITRALVKGADSRVFASEDARGCFRVMPGDSLMFDYTGKRPEWCWRLIA